MDGTLDTLNIELVGTTAKAKVSINDLITSLEHLDAKLGSIKNLEVFKSSMGSLSASLDSVKKSVGEMDVSKFKQVSDSFNSISRASGKLATAVRSLTFTKVQDEAQGFTREIQRMSQTLASEFGIKDKAIIKDLENQLTEFAKMTNNAMFSGGSIAEGEKIFQNMTNTLYRNKNVVNDIGTQYEGLVNKIKAANVQLDFQKSEFTDMYAKMRNAMGKGWSLSSSNKGGMPFDAWLEALTPEDISLMQTYGYKIGDTVSAFQALYDIKKRYMDITKSGAVVENEVNSTMNGTRTAVYETMNAIMGLSQQLGQVSTIGQTEVVNTFQTMAQGIKNFEGISLGSVEQIKTLSSAVATFGRGSTEKAITNIPLVAKAFKEMMRTLSTAPTVSRNVVDVANALANLSKSGLRANSTMNAIAPSFRRFSDNAKRASHSVRGLAGQFGKFYATFWLLLRVFRRLGDAIDLSSQLTEIENVINQTFGNMRGVIDDMTKDSITKFGMSELAVKKYGARFQAMGAALGITSEQVKAATSRLSFLPDEYGKLGTSMADVSTNLTRLTADMASFYDVAQDDVAEDLESIFTGMTRPLRRYGIDLTQANLKEWALNRGLNANIDSMTQAEKTMLRYQYVMERAQYAMGDFTRTADTWHNQINILKANIQQLAIVIGQGFINALKPLVRGLNAMLVKITSFATAILNALGQIFGWKYELNLGGITQDLDDGAGYAEDMSDGLGGAAKNAKKLKQNLLGIDELNIISPDDDGSGSGGGGGAAGGAGALDNTDVIRAVKTGDSLMRSAIKDLESLGKHISDALSNSMENISWSSVYEKARSFGTGLADFMNGMFAGESGKRLFENTGRTIAGALNTALESVNAFASEYRWDEVGRNIASGMNKFFRTWKPALAADTFNNMANGILDLMISALDTVDWELIGEQVGTALANIKWSKVLRKMVKVLGKAISGAFKSIEVSFEQAPFETAILGAFAALKFTKLGKMLGALAVNKLFGKEGLLKLSLKGAAVKIGEKIAWQGTTLAAVLKNMLASSLGIQASSITAALGVWTVPIAIAVAFSIAKVVDDFTVSESELRKSFTGWDEFKEKIVETADAIESTTTNMKSLKAEHESNIKYIESTSGELNTLANRYFELANKTSLTAEEKTQLSNIVQELIARVPELSKLYDEESGSIRGTRDEVLSLVDAQIKELKIEASKEYLTNLYKERYDAIEEMKQAYNDYTDAMEYNKEQSLEVMRQYHSHQISFYEYQKSLEKLGEETKKAADNFKASADNVDTLGNSINSMTQDLYGTTEDLSAFSVAFNGSMQDMANGTNEFTGMSNALADLGNESAVAADKVSGLSTAIKDSTGSSSANFDTFGKSTAEALAIGRNAVSELSKSVLGLNNDTNLSLAKSNVSAFQQSTSTSMSLANHDTTAFSGAIDVLKRTSNMSTAQSNIKTFGNSVSSDMKNVKSNTDGAKNSINDTTTATKNLMNESGKTFEVKTNVSPLEKLKTTLGDVVRGLRDMFSFNGQTVTTYTHTEKRANGGIFVNGHWKDVAAYASGGLPTTGQMFIAREAGPELVGSIGGHTAVMNNDQIVSSVAYGVRQAVAEVLVPYLANIAATNEEIAEKDMSVNIGDRDIAMANRRGSRDLGASLRTN